MILRRLQARNFGKFQDLNLAFPAQKTLYYAPNEAGKTSILILLRALFYGLGTRHAQDNLRSRFSSWSGSKGQASLEFTYQGNLYLLSRSFGPTAAQDEVRLLNLSLHTDVPLDPQKSVGEFLFQLPENIFLNTFFLSGPELEIKAGELSPESFLDHFTSFLVHPEEDLKLSTIFQRLKQERLKLRSLSGHKGQLIEQAQLIEETKKNLALAKSASARYNELLEQLAQLKEEQARKEATEAKQQAQISQLEQEEASLISSLQYHLLQEKKLLEESLAASLAQLGVADENEMTSQISAFITQVKSLPKKAQTSAEKSPARPGFFLILALALLLLILCWLSSFSLGLKVLLTIILSALVLILGSKCSKTQPVASELETSLASLLEQAKSFGSAPRTTSYDLAKQDLEQIAHELEKLQEEFQVKQAQVTSLKEELAYLRGLESKLKDLAQPQTIESDAELALAWENLFALQKQLARQKEASAPDNLPAEIYLLQGQLAELEKDSSSSLEEEVLDLENLLAEQERAYESLKLRYQALELAETELSLCLKNFRQELIPELLGLAGKYLSHLTMARYNKLLLKDNWQIELWVAETKAYQALSYFSQGTKAQVYLALRLALCHLLGQNHLPLVLDDVCHGFDPARTAQTLSLLDQFESQIIFLTSSGTVVETALQEKSWQVKELLASLEEELYEEM